MNERTENPKGEPTTDSKKPDTIHAARQHEIEGAFLDRLLMLISRADTPAELLTLSQVAINLRPPVLLETAEIRIPGEKV